jgi:hypothetical protein
MKLCGKIFFLILWACPSAWAAFSNYNSILVGDQAAGMGGAYTALYEDASALAWYNPAGLAVLQGKSFSAAVGIYKKFDTHYGTDRDFAKATFEVNQGFFRALPSSTGSVVRFEDFLSQYTLAFSIIVPEYDNFKGNIANTQTDISSLSFTDESLWVGGAISRKINDQQSLGLTVYYTARSMMKSIINRTFSGTDQLLYTEDRAIKENFVVMILGYQQKLNEQWSFGFSIRPESYQVFGRGSYYEALIDTAGTTDYVINQPDLKSKTKIPSKLAAGIGWKFSSELLFSADVAFYPPTNYSDLEDSTRAELIEHNQVINGALGAEYAWKSWLKFRIGGFTNFSSHPNPDPQRVMGQADRVDQLGFSANAALKSGPIQYTFGGYYTGGWGRSVQRVNQVNQVLPKAQQVFTMLVGTSF